MPLNTFRPRAAGTGDSTALGSPSLVIVTSVPPATNSKRAESFAFAVRSGIESPTPGSATASLRTEADGFGCGYFNVVDLVFMRAM